MNKTKFVTNVFIMTLSMFIIRIVSMSFNIYISSIIGGEEIGLFQLVFSVYAFAITFSTSGISIAVTRLVSEQIGALKSRAVDHILNKCILISLMFSLTAATLLFFGSDFIAVNMVRNSRAAIMLKVLAPALPFLAISAVLRGYFIGLRKIVTTTASQLIEEFSGIFITFYLIRTYMGIENACLAMIIGCSISEALSCIYDLTMYNITKRKYLGERLKKKAKYSDVLKISMPIALGSYLRTGLVSIENLLIPIQLAKHGIVNALAKYGIIKGMAMQVAAFPFVFIQSFISLIVPELAERNAAGRKKSVNNTTVKAIEYTLYFSFIVFAMLFIYHKQLSLKMYKSIEVGTYICLLSLLCVPMYLDSVVDGMLKGLNQQMSSLKYNIIDSILRVACIYFIVPRMGIISYIGILYGSEILNLTLSLGRLIKVTKIRLNVITCVVQPIISVLGAYFITALIVKYFVIFNFIYEMVIFLILYIIMLTITVTTRLYHIK